MIDEKIKALKPKNKEIIVDDNISSLIKNNVKADSTQNNKKNDNISVPDNATNTQNIKKEMNKIKDNSSNEIDDIMNNLVNGL